MYNWRMEIRKSVQLRHRWQNIAVFGIFWAPIVVIACELLLEGSVNWFVVAFTIVALLLLVWPTAFIIDMLIPTMAKEHGIRTYNSMSIPRTILWEDIRGVKKMTVWPALTYLSIIDGSGYPSRGLLPTYSDDKKAFYDEVVSLKGEEHTLVRALKAHGFAE